MANQTAQFWHEYSFSERGNNERDQRNVDTELSVPQLYAYDATAAWTVWSRGIQWSRIEFERRGNNRRYMAKNWFWINLPKSFCVKAIGGNEKCTRYCIFQCLPSFLPDFSTLYQQQKWYAVWFEVYWIKCRPIPYHISLISVTGFKEHTKYI